MRLRPAWWQQWHTDAAQALLGCIALGALGGVIGALTDRRLRCGSCSCRCSG
jgi:hypothetical protein